MEKESHILWELFCTFAKIGAFTFGGGYAMISLITSSCVEQKHWITDDEMMNITVLAESTPGPIAINAATYVGYQQAGMAGALIATLGIILPSFLLIFFISSHLSNFLEIPLVAKAFAGIRLAVGVLILDAGVNMIRKMPKKKLPRTIMAFSFLTMLTVNVLALPVSSIQLMIFSGLVSLLLFTVKKKPQKGGAAK